ncbi:hypothetical protein IQ241_16190 [Romeria aff. gracilis LEGE 07310]|uniref:Uncharacterized protein n=1 Tax=Vasconcelosia minhoensis LEGE 07310 TaxID=915328 RepID=A0A8J7DNY9_9CYAN|nr:hypothetical protein [Romeria gracilis]MBE9078815.1 hypothetical protein [Romeria aff. gracilis LEGE 07310]
MSALTRPASKRTSSQRSSRRPRKAYWFERIMAVIALVNLILVLFDLSYIRFRDQYLRFFPELTVWYGEQLKGIEPERATVSYLRTVDSLISQVETSGLEASESQEILADLRQQSVEIIDEDPFALANKSGTLEQIKNEIRDRIGEESAKQSFQDFWRVAWLRRQGFTDEIGFFNDEIRPLMETNYYRGIDETGGPIDRFWLIDIWFMALFAGEFVARTYFLSRRHDNVTWFDAMLWRLYDVPLFLGFWRWLRVIPVTVRLNQSNLVDMDPLRNRLNRIFISQFAVELTEIVILRVIDQAQNLVRKGEISEWLLSAADQRRYIDLNGVDEVQTITQRVSSVILYQVLPQIKPQLDALLQHSVASALHQAPAYQGLKLLPGVAPLSDQISHQLATELSKSLYEGLQNAFSDETGAALTEELVSQFSASLRTEISKDNTLSEIQSLVNVLLEEIKINYVERLSAEDFEQLDASRYRLYDATRQGEKG